MDMTLEIRTDGGDLQKIGECGQKGLCCSVGILNNNVWGCWAGAAQISVSKAGPYGTAAAKNGPSGSAYITYKRAVDARRCIETVHGAVWEGAAAPVTDGPSIVAVPLLWHGCAGWNGEPVHA
jgi:hypothetical protein